LSVVVVSIAGSAHRDRAVEALRLQSPEGPHEVLVMGREEGRTVPERRACGVAAARGDVVAIIEDTCVPAPGWAHALRLAHARGEAVIGGAVIPAPGLSGASVAAFLVEFGAYLPAAGGPTRHVAGCNFSYARALLEQERAAWRDGLYETFLNEQLAGRGAPVLFEPAALVLYGAATPLPAAVRDRFHHGRTYGGLRYRGRRAAGLAHAALAPFLVPLMAWRTARAIARAGEAGRRLWNAYPLTIPLIAAWAAGELIGAAAGPGGSTERWS
jgi:hypothetical protein